MASSKRAINILLRELKRRKVVQTAVAYGAVAWLLLQFGSIAFETFESPAWSMRVLFVILLAGLPLTVVLSWIFEIGPGGVDRTASHDEFNEQPVAIHSENPSTLLKALSLVFLTALVALIWTLLPGLKKGAEGPVPTLAVLPFTDPLNINSSALLIDGLSDDLFNALARIDNVQIAARRSSRLLKNTDKSVQEIGLLLNAMLLLEGEIRPENGRLKVTAWLTETDTGLERWNRTYEQPEGRLDLIREDLTRQLADELGLTVSSEIFAIQKAVVQQDLNAYPMYLEALGYLKLPMTEDSLNNAQQRFEEVIIIAPDYLAARAGLCRTHLAWYVQYRDVSRFEVARDYCLEALNANEDNVDMLLALGDVYRIQGDNVEAREFYERGLALNATNVGIRLSLTKLFVAENDKDAAERSLLQALALDPAYDLIHTELGNLYIQMGRWSEAIASYQKVTELSPENFRAFTRLGSAYFYAGNFAQAASAYERSLQMESSGIALSNTATMHFYSGDFERAAELYLQATEFSPKDHRLWVNLADTESQIPGSEDKANAHYHAAYALMLETLTVNEKDAETLALTAWCEINLEAPQAAELHMTEAILLDSENPVILYYAAQVNFGLDKKDLAENFVKKSLEKGFPAYVMAATPGLLELIPPKQKN
ncbi:MAG: tetratricopeptide (TPR) repeat protein [Gammaproteobacteria bacterium]|jgi:tetratricopeptide (TPR) repeat protein